jgi:hypothetical protein
MALPAPPLPDDPFLEGASPEAYPAALREAEIRLIHARRELALPGSDPGAPAVGLALSGGGIRSATFSLGVLQALARGRLLRRVDLVSTVSGGGYVGCFLGGLFLPRQGGADGHAAPEGRGPDRVEPLLADLQSPALRWLRDNGRYLTPGGSGDTLLLAAVTLRNWVALQCVLLSAVAALLLITALATTWIFPARLFQVASPLLTALPLAVVLCILAPSWAYWLTCPAFTGRAGPGAELNRAALWTTLGAILLASAPFALPWTVVAAALRGTFGGHWRLGFLALDASAALGLLIAGILVACVGREGGGERLDPAWAPRHCATLLLRWGLLLTLVLATLALLDSGGQWVFTFLQTKRFQLPHLAASLAATIAAAAPLLQRSAQLLAPREGRARSFLRVPLPVILGLVALVLLSAFLMGFSALVHGVRLGWQTVAPQPHAASLARLGIAFGIMALLTLLQSFNPQLLNFTSQGPFYSAMLTRAYLGASNKIRNGRRTEQMLEGDDLDLADYRPEAQGGPLHLLNVTVNETIGDSGQLVQRDRKGMGLALGPAGFSLAVRHHALWAGGKRGVELEGLTRQGHCVFPKKAFAPESLSLGRWMGISGAAFTTGLGSQTNLGASLLCGFLNVRLGHWWDSRAARAPRFWTPILYGGLFQEFLAKFKGTRESHWYLSDGGHSENTGAYELIRRRVPLLLVCDDGADADYRFEDLANLVERVRTDFSVELHFLDRNELRVALPQAGKLGVGTLEELREAKGGRPVPVHACLGRIDYPGDTPRRGWLLLLKPVLPEEMPLDVRAYSEKSPTFPQESTLDQFFDEAQWESYRRLGDLLATRLFARGWEPFLRECP